MPEEHEHPAPHLHHALSPRKLLRGLRKRQRKRPQPRAKIVHLLLSSQGSKEVRSMRPLPLALHGIFGGCDVALLRSATRVRTVESSPRLGSATSARPCRPTRHRPTSLPATNLRAEQLPGFPPRRRRANNPADPCRLEGGVLYRRPGRSRDGEVPEVVEAKRRADRRPSGPGTTRAGSKVLAGQCCSIDSAGVPSSSSSVRSRAGTWLTGLPTEYAPPT
jgi:hypothetical protein